MIFENTFSGRRGIIDDWMAADFEPKSTKPKSVQDFYAAFWIKQYIVCYFFIEKVIIVEAEVWLMNKNALLHTVVSNFLWFESNINYISDPDIVSKLFLLRKRIIPEHPAGRPTSDHCT